MRRFSLPSCLLVLLTAIPAHAQMASEPPNTEVMATAGYAGSPAGAPGRVVVGLGMSYWFARHVGAGWDLGAGAGRGGLLLQTVTLRYRQPVGGPLTLVVGAGIFGGRYDSTNRGTATIGGFAYDVFVQKAMKHDFSLEGGLVTCFDGKSVAYRQVIIAASVGFR